MTLIVQDILKVVCFISFHQHKLRILSQKKNLSMQVNKHAIKEEQVLKYFLTIQLLMIDKNILLK